MNIGELRKVKAGDKLKYSNRPITVQWIEFDDWEITKNADGTPRIVKHTGVYFTFDDDGKGVTFSSAAPENYTAQGFA